MGSKRSGGDRDADNPAEDARWEAYLALMRKAGKAQFLPGLEDAGADNGLPAQGGFAEAEPGRQDPADAPLLETKAQPVDVVIHSPVRPRSRRWIGPRERAAMIAGVAALIALCVLALASILGGQTRQVSRPLTMLVPGRPAAVGPGLTHGG